jgi:hypothetical protein
MAEAEPFGMEVSPQNKRNFGKTDSVRPPQSPDDLLCRGIGEQFDLGLTYR